MVCTLVEPSVARPTHTGEDCNEPWRELGAAGIALVAPLVAERALPALRTPRLERRAPQAALQRRLLDEVPVATMRTAGAVLWDLEKFYDSIDLLRLCDEEGGRLENDILLCAVYKQLSRQSKQGGGQGRAPRGKPKKVHHLQRPVDPSLPAVEEEPVDGLYSIAPSRASSMSKTNDANKSNEANNKTLAKITIEHCNS